MGSKILNIIKKIEEGILFLFLAVILLACFFQVIGRYTPLPFSSAFEEIAVNLFIWMTLLGAGVCVRTHSHMRMDIIDTFLPEKIKPYFGTRSRCPAAPQPIYGSFLHAECC